MTNMSHNSQNHVKNQLKQLFLSLLRQLTNFQLVLQQKNNFKKFVVGLFSQFSEFSVVFSKKYNLRNNFLIKVGRV